MKIAIIHATVNAVAPLMAAIKKFPNLQGINFVNDSLLAYTGEHGVDKYILRQFTKTLFAAIESKPDGIIVACNVFCPYVELMKNFTDIPMIAIDSAMLQKAATCGKKVGIIATNNVGGDSAKVSIENLAKAVGFEPKVLVTVEAEAAQALNSGDMQSFKAIIKAAAAKLKESGCEVMVLAQITLACCAEYVAELGVEVLTSPDEGVKYLLELINASEAK